MTRRVKLVCTLGPATAAAGAVRALAEAGAGVFRVNLSHGTPGSRRDAVEAVRRAGEELGRDLAVMADLPGPKIRLGELAAEPVLLREGAPFVLRAAGGPGDATGAATSYPFLAQDLRPGDRVFLADGSVELVVRETRAADVVTEVVRGGHVRSRAGVNVPAERLSLPAVTEADRRALREALDVEGKRATEEFQRAIAELGRALVATHFGTADEGGSWPVPVLELTARAFRIPPPGRRSRLRAAERYLDTMVAAKPSELASTFGWAVDEARALLETLVRRGRASRDDALGYVSAASGPGGVRRRST